MTLLLFWTPPPTGTGGANLTEAADTLTSAAALAISATAALTDVADTVTSVARLAIAGSVSSTAAADTATVTATRTLRSFLRVLTGGGPPLRFRG